VERPYAMAQDMGVVSAEGIAAGKQADHLLRGC
jgi:hypothetical protein